MTALAPASTALEMASVIPRSLNEPVGLAPSTLRYRSMQGVTSRASRSARISGVLPSFRVITGVCSVTGRNFRYSSLIPRQGLIGAARAQLTSPASGPSTRITVVGSDMNGI